MFGVTIIVFSGAFLNGMFRNWATMQIEASKGAFQIEHRDYYEKKKLDPLKVVLRNSSNLIKDIETVPGVSAFGELEISGLISNGNKSTTFMGKGVDIQGQSKTLRGSKNLIKTGHPLSSDLNEIVLGQFLAEKLSV